MNHNMRVLNLFSTLPFSLDMDMIVCLVGLYNNYS